MTAIGVAGFGNMTALSTSGSQPPVRRRPRRLRASARAPACSCSRSGQPPSARGATILGEVLGAASNADAHHITAPVARRRRRRSRACELALADAGLEPGDIGHINAHGTSTPLNDAAEAEAIAKVFGAPGPPITSIKGVTGHALGAAGALEAVAVLLSMRAPADPADRGHHGGRPGVHDRPRRRRRPAPWTPGPTISNSFGFGGHNGSVILGPA